MSKRAERKKVKNGEKSPWRQCLTRPVPNGRRRSGFWLVPENFCVFLPNQKAAGLWVVSCVLTRNNTWISVARHVCMGRSWKQPYVYEWSLIFFHKSLFGDIKLSDLERRNRKLSAHDCTDHIKTLFSSDNYHETKNKNTSQAAMFLAPGHNCATLLVPVHKVQNVLTVFQLNTTWRRGNVQLVLIVALWR